jgi:hypothetical protein
VKDLSYSPIEDYGAIGNLRTSALVSLSGSIDWCCLPDLDDPSVFAALLDHERGGCWQVRPAGDHGREQCYIEHTNVLETAFRTDAGRLVVTDFMPLAGSLDGVCGSVTEPAIYRLLLAEDAPVEVEVLWNPRFGYANGETRIMRTAGGHMALAGGDALVIAGLPADAEILADRFGAVLRARFELKGGGTQGPGVTLGRGGRRRRIRRRPAKARADHRRLADMGAQRGGDR